MDNGQQAGNGVSKTACSVTPVPDGAIAEICERFGNDKHRMLDILREVQDRFQCIAPATMDQIAEETGLTRIEVEGVASFYSFLSLKPKGRITIRLCDDIVDRYAGLEAVTAAFEDVLGVKIGETSADGAVSLEYTPCIGMCDQAPAAMVNDIVLTNLTAQSAREVAEAIIAGKRPEDLVSDRFATLSPHERALRMVDNNIRHAGAVLLGPVPEDAGLSKAVSITSSQIISMIEEKWRFAAAERAERSFVICNADEGEPGHLQGPRSADRTAASDDRGHDHRARAPSGNAEGILYLRGEYVYLRELLEQVLEERRAARTAGRAILGVSGFRFRYPHPDGRRGLYLRRGRRADQFLRRAAG
jgi:[NiFe] hydrogenase diaphorase moiety large subunit